ncbi:hypothetical protein NP233_g1082 [Leucocoprinus birnbaumii]|uniref:FAD-binding PCMH-type domain-containing protein n=1 Tax=Leucocoprinus birnbaumii TaxID=56174 RepID=A0AAD5W109_9AGAR|nr:hypothetical protein NP233_g1082 [Leucocoprinus birnbaumii]
MLLNIMLSHIYPLLGLLATAVEITGAARSCRNVPGSPGYPTAAQWQSLGESVSGRLVHAIPSGLYCRQTNCTDAQWTSANWRNDIPGAMNMDYDSNPPSLCGRTTPETCGQGDVPLYAILAENVEDIQAGVNFAREHNLRLSIKASGHDLLGRSTAKKSLLIHTHKLQSIEFTEHFHVGGKDLGSAVTVGSGVSLSTLYNASKVMDKIFVGGTAATVVAAGGYVQGGGHSALSPLHGLAADNALEFNVVTADGLARRVNEAENSDLFWAMRGGGPGTWGVIVNATFRTYPTFNATSYSLLVAVNDSSAMSAIVEAHAKHAFDLDSMHGGSYFAVTYIGSNFSTYVIDIEMYLPNATSEQAIAAWAPYMEDITEAGGVVFSNTTTYGIINELLALNDDQIGGYAVLGGRLIPESIYRQSPEAIGDTYKRLIDAGALSVATGLLAGGQVAKNADIDNSVNPGWRTAKAQTYVINIIPDQGSIEEIHAAEYLFRTTQLPILESISGTSPAAYSNEADPFEIEWQKVFYGKNYPRLSSIKARYDPNDLFIVRTGVGAERWDSDEQSSKTGYQAVVISLHNQCRIMLTHLYQLLGLTLVAAQFADAQNCRNAPGSPGYPSDAQWQALNESVSNRLVHAVPSGSYCRRINCTDDEWTSANWRNEIPGAMNLVNFEQDYDSNPPSLCGRTAPEICGQGDVPLYAILAETVEDIQAGVKFARQHNLRLSVKASGHDLLGRSTAKSSLLIHTHKLQSIEFTDSFHVGSIDYGSAATIASGVALNTMYNASRAANKILVGGSAATVVAAGGYVQGAGHSALSPLFGLAADNVLEFNVVTADGTVRRVNEAENSDLFWAMRGGGAGSWGVIVNATFRTYPTFDAAQSTMLFTANGSTTIGAICEAHARHAFDLDSLHAGMYFGLTQTTPNSSAYTIGVSTVIPNLDSRQANNALGPLFEDIISAGAVVTLNMTSTANINQLLFAIDDAAGYSGGLGSRLIPESSYRHSPEAIGDVCKRLVDLQATLMSLILVSGGKVAENAHIDSAVNPGWRTAKAHFIVGNAIVDEENVQEVHTAQNMFKTTQLPVLQDIAGSTPAAYSNEADLFEEDWQSVFYGKNYNRLSSIKTRYDPTDLFMVRTGVGSERWDSDVAIAACAVHARRCRNTPGSPGYPTVAQWNAFNQSLSGRLVQAVPSGEACRQVNCTDAEWASATWRNTIPGAMNQVNWEQDYDSNPPSLCGRTMPATCGQGDVSLYAILAENADDIKAGVRFARQHDLRLSVKASGHDYLGRSTAKNSLLIHTHKLQSISFTDNFIVGHTNKGSAVTVGSGVNLSSLYNATQQVGKIFVGGTAATVVAGGGYVQGAGHSALSPLLGLAADNTLEFSIVTADGVLRKANEIENPELFWALRGGGAGSWGVIVSATFRTFPTFPAVRSQIVLAVNSSMVGMAGEIYAKHAFDWDAMHAGQYFWIVYSGTPPYYGISIDTTFPNATELEATTALAPLLADLTAMGAFPVSNNTQSGTVNEVLVSVDDSVGEYLVLGSRLIPSTSYKSPEKIGKAYQALVDQGTLGILSHLVAGGKAAENAHINSAVNPAWRSAKMHLIVPNEFSETSNLTEVNAAQNNFRENQLPIFKPIQGPIPGAYSNEADPFEEEWQSVFYGPNYPRLSIIKRLYDPTDLFIVRAGVGSERWDSDGLCRV